MTLRSYSRGQAVETRGKRGGVEHWRPAKIHEVTSRGAKVIWPEGPQQPQHVLFVDLRPVNSERLNIPKQLGRPVLTPEDIDRMNLANAPPAPSPSVAEEKPSAKPRTRKMGVAIRRLTTNELCPALGKYLRRVRLGMDLDQRALGEKISLSNVTVSRIERGIACPSDDLLIAYVEHLSLDLDYLLQLRDLPRDVPAPPPPDKPQFAHEESNLDELAARYCPPARTVLELAESLSLESDTVTLPPRSRLLPFHRPPPPKPKPKPTDDVFAFLDFCQKIAAIAPAPEGKHDVWQRAVASLWSLR